MTKREERYREATRLRETGLTWREVAEKMGLSRSYVTEVVYDHTGEKDRKRKLERYSGKCQSCGRPTSYPKNGKAQPPKICRSCYLGREAKAGRDTEKERACKEPGCTTVLSRYNRDFYCSVHQQVAA